MRGATSGEVLEDLLKSVTLRSPRSPMAQDPNFAAEKDKDGVWRPRNHAKCSYAVIESLSFDETVDEILAEIYLEKLDRDQLTLPKQNQKRNDPGRN